MKPIVSDVPRHGTLFTPAFPGAELFLWRFGFGSASPDELLFGKIETGINDSLTCAS